MSAERAMATPRAPASATGSASVAPAAPAATPMAADVPAIDAVDLSKRYGGVTALAGVSLQVDSGEIFGIIGPNGAGKSTLFDVLCGITKPSGGQIRVLGHDVTQLPPFKIARAGVARTFQRTAVFGQASVIDNLRYGMHAQMGHSLLAPLWRSARFRQDEALFEQRAEQVLAATGLRDDRQRLASTLAYGVQRRLAVGIALMSEPVLMFLDEPAAGMNGHETDEFIALIKAIAPGRTVVIVEHDMAVIEQLCGRALVMVNGRPVTIDTPHSVLRHPEVVSAYLGADDD